MRKGATIVPLPLPNFSPTKCLVSGILDHEAEPKARVSENCETDDIMVYHIELLHVGDAK
jgi:hypothetical protein